MPSGHGPVIEVPSTVWGRGACSTGDWRPGSASSGAIIVVLPDEPKIASKIEFIAYLLRCPDDRGAGPRRIVLARGRTRRGRSVFRGRTATRGAGSASGPSLSRDDRVDVPAVDAHRGAGRRRRER
ncbi:Uncharacterised protein [Mycobacteroides abscessus]|nr:Uncharacterised protein [Mycobacteroides abscessus]